MTDDKRLTVIVPDGNGYADPKNLSRIEDHFRTAGLEEASFEKDGTGIPKKDGHGAYTLITPDAEATKASLILSSHYDLIVV